MVLGEMGGNVVSAPISAPEHAYADLVGLRQFLPGPASSQVGFSIELMRAGYLGAFAA